MKKIFLVLMAVAAIAMTSCDPKNNPNDPNGGNNSGNNNTQVKSVKAVIALGIAEEFLQVADICIYDSITGQTSKAETLTTFYSDAEPNALGAVLAKYDTKEFAGAHPYKGIFLHTTLSSDNSFGVRTEVKLKDNFIEILKGLEAEKINMGAVCGLYDEKNFAENGLHTTVKKSIFELSTMIPALEKDPTRLDEHIAMINRMLSGTFYLDNGNVSMK